MIENCDVLAGNDRLISLIKKYRNAWFHGYFIGDKYKDIRGNEYVLDEFMLLYFLYDLNACFKINPKLDKICECIQDYCETVYNATFLRIVELSYKILDSRLFLENKLHNRILNAQLSYNRINNINTSYLKHLGKLYAKDKLYLSPSKSTFTDKIERVTICNELSLIHFYSKDFIQIGEHNTESKDLYIAKINLNESYQLKINNKYISDYSLSKRKVRSRNISMYDICLDSDDSVISVPLKDLLSGAQSLIKKLFQNL